MQCIRFLVYTLCSHTTQTEQTAAAELISPAPTPVLTAFFVSVSQYSLLTLLVLTLLVGRQEEHPVLSDVVLVWLAYMSGARCRLFAYPADASATASQNLIISCLI